MSKIIRQAMGLFLLFTILCGLAYPTVVTGFAQGFFPGTANGDASLLGQTFTAPEYLIGRPTEGLNLSPLSPEAQALRKAREDFLRSLDSGNDAEIPGDLLSGSGSGADPNISVEAAAYQVSRIARARGVNEAEVRAIISRYTTGRFLGIFGEPAVNVLKVNLALDEMKKV